MYLKKIEKNLEKLMQIVYTDPNKLKIVLDKAHKTNSQTSQHTKYTHIYIFVNRSNGHRKKAYFS